MIKKHNPHKTYCDYMINKCKTYTQNAMRNPLYKTKGGTK